jgi:hypothetical protein
LRRHHRRDPYVFAAKITVWPLGSLTPISRMP